MATITRCKNCNHPAQRKGYCLPCLEIEKQRLIRELDSAFYADDMDEEVGPNFEAYSRAAYINDLENQLNALGGSYGLNDYLANNPFDLSDLPLSELPHLKVSPGEIDMEFFQL
jgi:hypothetical protein